MSTHSTSLKPAGKPAHAGLFLISLATLMFEILLTRIFSVTIWNHFAFVAISTAMFGLAAGALAVYLFPTGFPVGKTAQALTLGALLTGLSMILAIGVHLSVPFDLSGTGLVRLAFMYTSVSLPFFFCGITVCLALTRFPESIGTLYCADLIGAAFGCLLVVVALESFDAPTAVLLSGALAASSGICFSLDSGAAGRKWAGGLTLILVAACAGHAILFQYSDPILRPRWVRGQQETAPLFEKWNSFSRLTVHGERTARSEPFGWGLSPAAPRDRIGQLFLTIDSTAGTVLTEFDGNLGKLDYLRYDVTNIVHHIRRDARVMIIGAGGGRDVLSALVFGQNPVLAVEVNNGIVQLLSGVFGEFTGHLDRQTGVRFVTDEARSFLERTTEVFDVVQMSLVDTWAATSAGAFVLTESALYTVEAWETVLNRLTTDGIYSISRYYDPAQPHEVGGLVALATAALQRIGTDTPRRHMLLVLHTSQTGSGGPPGIGTLLLKRTPFTAEEVSRIETVAERMGFRAVLGPALAAANPQFDNMGFGDAPARDVPTDDRPFFFNTATAADYLDPQHPIFVLTALLVTVVVLVALCILLPLLLAGSGVGGVLPLVAYFGAIGSGFMLVEVALLQRLIIFLGHPVYALSVLLFGLLVAGGVGSFSTRNVPKSGLVGAASRGLALLVGLVAAVTFLNLQWFQGWETVGRICIALVIIGPLGLLMGRALPLGMQIANYHSAAATPWMWGINGATSVLASVVGVLIAMSVGISAVLWCGAASYLVAIVAVRRTQRLVVGEK